MTKDFTKYIKKKSFLNIFKRWLINAREFEKACKKLPKKVDLEKVTICKNGSIRVNSKGLMSSIERSRKDVEKIKENERK